jgi:hypothetical protein
MSITSLSSYLHRIINGKLNVGEIIEIDSSFSIEVKETDPLCLIIKIDGEKQVWRKITQPAQIHEKEEIH